VKTKSHPAVCLRAAHARRVRPQEGRDLSLSAPRPALPPTTILESLCPRSPLTEMIAEADAAAAAAHARTAG